MKKHNQYVKVASDPYTDRPCRQHDDWALHHCGVNVKLLTQTLISQS